MAIRIEDIILDRVDEDPEFWKMCSPDCFKCHGCSELFIPDDYQKWRWMYPVGKTTGVMYLLCPDCTFQAMLDDVGVMSWQVSAWADRAELREGFVNAVGGVDVDLDDGAITCNCDHDKIWKLAAVENSMINSYFSQQMLYTIILADALLDPEEGWADMGWKVGSTDSGAYAQRGSVYVQVDSEGAVIDMDRQ